MKAKFLVEPVLVGREKELAELNSCLDLAVEGKGTIVFVSGEAGAGKTRLVKEFLSTAKEKGITLLSGWCLSDTVVPYLPFAEAFRKHFSTDEEGMEGVIAGKPQFTTRLWSSPFGAHGAAAHLPGLGLPVKQAQVAATISPQVWKDQLFAGVAETLHSMSSKQPVVFLIEDAHWADSASLALLHYIARVVDNAERILLLVTFRSEELTSDAEGRPHQLSETLRMMRREELLKEIKLSGLDQACVSKMAETMMGASLQEEFAKRLAAESSGNPLFVVESLRMLHEREGLFEENNEWRLAVDELDVPSKIKDIILGRLALLKHAQRRILDAASVIGEEFNAELLSAVLGQDSLGVLETLNMIAQSTSIVRVEGARYRFDHARSREVLYEALSLPLKRGYHARIAERLEVQSKTGRVSLADLAFHFAEAQNEEKAVKHSLAAGQEEVARWSNTEAARHFRYVLERIGNSPERFGDRLSALEGLGDAYYAGDSFQQAANTFKELASLQSGAGKLRALRKAMFAAWYLGDIPLLVKFTQEAEENATADRLEAGRVLHQKARVFAIRGDNVTCFKISEDALRIFEEEYALADAAWVLFTMGPTSRHLREYETGIAAALRSIALYDDLGDKRSQLEAYVYTGSAFSVWTFYEEGKRIFEKVIDLNEQFRMEDYVRLIPAYAFHSLLLLREALRSPDFSRENIHNSISKALKALEYTKKTDSNLYIGMIYELLTIGYSLVDDSAHRDEYFGKTVSLPEKILASTLNKAYLPMAMGVYYASKNEFERANKYFSEAIQNEESMGAGASFPRRRAFAWALSRQGRIEEAKSQLRLLEEFNESIQEKANHVNVQAGLMTYVHPEVNQAFEMRLDLVNVSRSEGSIDRVENLLVPGLTVVDASPNCLVHDGLAEFKDSAIKSFEVKTIKLTVKATKPEAFQVCPTVSYIDEMGNKKTSSTRAFMITAHPASAEAPTVGRIATGLADLDKLLLGGFPEGYAIALTSPSFDERATLIERFVETGARSGQTTYYLTDDPVKTKALAEELPLNMFLFVCNARADSMVKDLPNVYRLKGVENLTDIDIALAKATRQLGSSQETPRRACVEIVSDVLLQHHAVTTRRWLNGLIHELKSKGFTILAVINPQMHPAEESQAILDLFDGEVRISESETAQATERILRVKKLSGQRYVESELFLNKEKRD